VTRRARRINHILTLLALLLLSLLLFTNRGALGQTYLTLRSIEWELLAVLPALQLISHFFIANTYQAVFRIYGYRVPLTRTLPMVWALNFVNQILPSGGLSGLTYLIYGMRGAVPAGKATLAQLARYMLSYFSYGFVLLAAVAFLIVGGAVTRSTVLLIVWLVGVSVVMLSVILLLSSNARRVRGIIAWIGRTIDRFARPRAQQLQIETLGQKVARVLGDFYVDYRKIISQRHRLLWPLVLMLLSSLFENLIVVSSFWIVGADVNPGIIMVGFALANGIGVLSVVPGDVGVHEATIVAALTAAGVPVGIALSGTLLYRVFNKTVFLPIGFTAYSRLLKPHIPQRHV
jgi:uncharacterized protein (TIRG00374 family)